MTKQILDFVQNDHGSRGKGKSDRRHVLGFDPECGGYAGAHHRFAGGTAHRPSPTWLTDSPLKGGVIGEA